VEYLPINLRLRDQPVVLVGAGVIAARKARFLLAAGARLTAIAPEQDAQFAQLAAENSVHWVPRRYERRRSCRRGTGDRCDPGT
jgi:siroheme synthase-like protein